MLTLDVPTVASAAAVSVMLCGVPGVRVRVDGETATPDGRGEIETLTELLNPFAAVAEIVVCWPEAPVVRARLVGFMAMEKSGGGAAVTLSVTVAV